MLKAASARLKKDRHPKLPELELQTTTNIATEIGAPNGFNYRSTTVIYIYTYIIIGDTRRPVGHANSAKLYLATSGSLGTSGKKCQLRAADSG